VIRASGGLCLDSMSVPHRRQGLPPRPYTQSFAFGSRLPVVLRPLAALNV
jgi:hypothetical protein